MLCIAWGNAREAGGSLSSVSKHALGTQWFTNIATIARGVVRVYASVLTDGQWALAMDGDTNVASSSLRMYVLPFILPPPASFFLHSSSHVTARAVCMHDRYLNFEGQCGGTDVFCVVLPSTPWPAEFSAHACVDLFSATSAAAFGRTNSAAKRRALVVSVGR